MKTSKYPYIIAEIGGNHNGDMDLAKKMIKVAKECGADAVKFQLYRGEELITKEHMKELNSGVVKLENVNEWNTKELGLNNIFEQVEKFAIQEKEHLELFQYAKKLKIDYASSCATKEEVDFLVEQKVAFLKIPSMDINNPEFILYQLSKNLPIIISLGLASLGEIEQVVNIIPDKFKHNVTLLHCISLYPPKDEIVNLKFIKTLKTNFDLKIGYSDHTLGFSIPLASVVYGVTVIEKHFTLDKEMPGWDHKVSANPEELKIICNESKRIVDALGDGRKVVTKDELDKRLKFRRSLISAHKLSKDHIITENDIVYKRPGTGINPDELKYVIGRKLNRNLKEDDILKWEDFV